MNPAILPRNIAGLAGETLGDTPITVVSGARQVGKSTLMHQLIQNREARVVNLENLSDRSAAEADPDGFAAQYPQGIFAIDSGRYQSLPPGTTSQRDQRGNHCFISEA